MLRNLDLSGYSYSHAMSVELSQANWPLLEQLNLRGHPLGSVGAAELAKAKWPLLEALDVCHDSIGPEKLRILMCNSSWPHLEHLEVQDSQEVYDLLEAEDNFESDPTTCIVSSSLNNLLAVVGLS